MRYSVTSSGFGVVNGTSNSELLVPPEVEKDSMEDLAVFRIDNASSSEKDHSS